MVLQQKKKLFLAYKRDSESKRHKLGHSVPVCRQWCIQGHLSCHLLPTSDGKSSTQLSNPLSLKPPLKFGTVPWTYTENAIRYLLMAGTNIILFSDSVILEFLPFCDFYLPGSISRTWPSTWTPTRCPMSPRGLSPWKEGELWLLVKYFFKNLHKYLCVPGTCTPSCTTARCWSI